MWDNFSLFFRTGLPSYVLYPSLGLALLVVLSGLLIDYVKDKKVFVLWVLLVEYVFIVVCSTIVFRPCIDYARWEWMPFWTYKAVINHISGVKGWDIILNVVLFMPLGLFLKLLFPKLSIIRMLLIAILCSLSIEILQNVLRKGISQFDDIMHNSLGCVLGWLLAYCCIRFKVKSVAQ